MSQNLTPGETELAPELNQPELLFRYYQVLKRDQLLHVGSFKNHVRNSQIIGTALLGILTFLLNTPGYSLTQNNIILWIAVMAAVTTVTYYLIHDVLEAVFAVRALDEYLSFLEERAGFLGLNEFFWQSEVAQKLWPTSAKAIGFLPPERCLGFYEILLIVGATIGLPGYVYYRAWRLSGANYWIDAAIVGLTLYSIISAVVTILVSHGINGKVRSKVRTMINQKMKAESTIDCGRPAAENFT